MKKTIIAVMVLAPATFLSSCTIREASYYPGYNSNYVYSTGYYGYRPYWNSFYSGYGWGNVGYWRGYRGGYVNRGIVSRGWMTRGWHGYRRW